MESEIEKLRAELEALKEQLARREQEIAALTTHQMKVINEWVARGEELENRIKQLETLISFATNITPPLPLEQILENAVDEIQKCLGVECCWSHLLRDDKLYLVAQRGWTPAMIEEARVLKLGQGVTGLTAQTGEPLIMDDISKDPRHTIISTQLAGYRSLLGVPIKYRERIWGVIGLASRIPGKLGELEKGIVIAIASMVAGALEHWKLDKELEEKISRLSTITRFTSLILSSLDLKEIYSRFVEHLKTIVPIDRVVLGFIKRDKFVVQILYEEVVGPWREGEEVPLAKAVASEIISTKKTHYIADLTKERRLETEEELVKIGIRSHLSLPLISKGEVFAILCLDSTLPDAYPQDKREILEEITGQISQAIFNQFLYEQLKERKRELEEAIKDISSTLVRVWESRYLDRKGHSDRVSRYARIICEKMGLPEEEKRKIELAARLHDIGVITVPDEIILKKEPLTLAERAQIELHPAIGAEILSPMPYFSEILPLIRHHHERYDGKGYPNGLKEKKIPLGARIIAVADAYDTMTSLRLYRPTLTHMEAIEVLKQGKGKQWDPEIVDIFLFALTSEE